MEIAVVGGAPHRAGMLSFEWPHPENLNLVELGHLWDIGVLWALGHGDGKR